MANCKIKHCSRDATVMCIWQVNSDNEQGSVIPYCTQHKGHGGSKCRPLPWRRKKL